MKKGDSRTGELFYVDKDGKKQDAALHDEMLNGISPEAEKRILASTKARTAQLGMGPAVNEYLEDTIPAYAVGGVVGGKKINRDAFLYMAPKPPKNSFAQCGTCRQFTGTGCLILGDTKITKDMSCGLYVRGRSQFHMKGREEALVPPKEAGLVDFQVRCENCKYGGDDCQLFEMLNEQLPETFDLETKIDPKGCCNAFTRK